MMQSTEYLPPSGLLTPEEYARVSSQIVASYPEYNQSNLGLCLVSAAIGATISMIIMEIL
jgi:hypothetical protein